MWNQIVYSSSCLCCNRPVSCRHTGLDHESANFIVECLYVSFNQTILLMTVRHRGLMDNSIILKICIKITQELAAIVSAHCLHFFANLQLHTLFEFNEYLHEGICGFGFNWNCFHVSRIVVDNDNQILRSVVPSFLCIIKINVNHFQRFHNLGISCRVRILS